MKSEEIKEEFDLKKIMAILPEKKRPGMEIKWFTGGWEGLLKTETIKGKICYLAINI